MTERCFYSPASVGNIFDDGTLLDIAEIWLPAGALLSRPVSQSLKTTEEKLDLIRVKGATPLGARNSFAWPAPWKLWCGFFCALLSQAASLGWAGETSTRRLVTYLVPVPWLPVRSRPATLKTSLTRIGCCDREYRITAIG